MRKKYATLLVVLASVCSFAVGAPADQRSYVWTYEYRTVEKGRAEVETYLTFATPDMGDIEHTMVSEHQIELEVGMTERFDFSIYQVFAQAPDEAIKYKKFKLRSRYRIGEKGKYVVDPLIYLEYKGKPNFSEHGIESKLILAKDIGKTNISVNSIFEWERDDEWEFELEYAAGGSYEINELLRAGLEAKGSKHGHYVGPVLSHGREDLWVSVGSAFKMGAVTEGRPEWQMRMVLGIGIR